MLLEGETWNGIRAPTLDIMKVSDDYKECDYLADQIINIFLPIAKDDFCSRC